LSDLLTAADLLQTDDDTIQQGDEDSLEGLFDLIIPPGVPQDIIMELIEEFNLQPVDRLININIAETDPRELLALRGDEESVTGAHDLMMELLKELIGEE